MSSSAGWYPDPGGQPGLYRWWTGSAWTEAVTPNPQSTPPPAGLGGGAGAPAQPQAGYGTPQPGYGQPGNTTSTPGHDPYQNLGAPRKRRATGWWIGGGAALIAVIVAILLVVRGMGVQIPGVPDLGNNPTSSVSPNICPPASTSSPLPTTAPNSDWITGGKLAYPALGSPWETGYDNRVPWGSLAMVQEVTDQENYDGQGNNWVASILVSDLFVGDGFASTKVASETVLKCVLGTYYADNVVTQHPISSQQHTVAGHSGWLIETQLSFDIPGLIAKGERVLLLVVQTGTDDYSLFYASIPDTRSNLIPDARQALAQLRVQ